MKHITITDIAKKLGISPATVSRALSGHPKISASTKEKVKKCARQFNYQPNSIARNLKNNKSMAIGVIVPDISHDFFSNAISGIEHFAYESGYTIIMCQSNEDYDREVINTNALIQQRVAGIIFCPSQNTKVYGHIQNVQRLKVPIVLFDRVIDEININKVYIDDEKSAYDAVTYLISRGYKRIAHFAGPQKMMIARNRAKGYKRALLEAGIKPEEELIISGGLLEADGAQAAEKMMLLNKMPEAIFAVNDPVAIGAFQKLKEKKIKIPEEIGIMGFSNDRITNLLDPPMTTMAQPSFTMGYKSAQLLIGIIESGISYNKPKSVILDTELIVRKSTL